MAFGKTNEIKDSSKIKKYVGVAPVTVLAVNPTKSELEKIYGRSLENDITYTGETEVTIAGVETKIKQVRIDFIVKALIDNENPELPEEELISKVSFFLGNSPRYNRDGTKVQIIDKYARTAWVSKEGAVNHEIPIYSNGPANIAPDYRMCFIGEDTLIAFVKDYLGIGNVMKYVDSTWVMKDSPEDFEASLDKIADYFKGDYKELRKIVNMQPNAKIKVLFGIKTTPEGKEYQTIYTKMFLKNNISNYTKLAADVESTQANGGLATSTFVIDDIKEYVVKPTNFSNDASGMDMTDDDTKFPFE